MSARNLQNQLALRLRWQKHAHMLERQDKTLKSALPVLRLWQTRRLASSFENFMQNPKTQPAAAFFLSDLYGDADFIQRDEEAAKILPKMARILPESLLQAAVDAIELSVLSHALDMRMAKQMLKYYKNDCHLDEKRYQEIYQAVGLKRLRRKQIDLIMDVGYRLDSVVKRHGVAKLLAASRLPARLLGLQHLQGFLERGFTAFNHLGGANDFLTEIHRQESAISRRLLDGDSHPFDSPFS